MLICISPLCLSQPLLRRYLITFGLIYLWNCFCYWLCGFANSNICHANCIPFYTLKFKNLYHPFSQMTTFFCQIWNPIETLKVYMGIECSSWRLTLPSKLELNVPFQDFLKRWHSSNTYLFWRQSYPLRKKLPYSQSLFV